MARPKTLVAVSALLAVLAVPTWALADACLPTTSTPDATQTVNKTTVYYVSDNCGGNCIYATFVYTESNGMPGLQRHDFAHDDTCGGLIVGDFETS